MGQISTKINLAALKNATILKMGKTQIDCLIIPIEPNSLYKSDKGAVYLDLVGFESKPREGSKDTHLVKQSFSKDKLYAMSEEEKKALPILGNHIDWDKSTGQSTQVEQTAQTAASEDDLPW